MVGAIVGGVKEPPYLGVPIGEQGWAGYLPAVGAASATRLLAS